MNADEFVAAVDECKRNRWQNSDIPEEGEIRLDTIAIHLSDCEDCRQQFDEMEYTEKTIDRVCQRDT